MEDSLRRSIETVKKDWERSPYFEDAEAHRGVFWNADSPFRRMFDKLDTRLTIELACGHGRHSEYLAGIADHLVVIDVFQGHIELTRRRLREFSNVGYVVGDGSNFRPLPEGIASAIVCYDSMVHFNEDIVASYLLDAARVLEPGGRFLTHLSNLDTAGSTAFYGHNPHARNHMTLPLLDTLIAHAGLALIETEEFHWDGVVGLDRIALLAKPVP